MDFVSVLIIGVLALAAAGLLAYLLCLRLSLKEAARELDDKLKTDTNTLISISSGDRAMRELAAQINNQLRALRRERLKLQHGDMELKTAVTNISHDLRTPLTAICGYLDLLEREPQSPKSAQYLAVIRERTEAMRNLTEELFRYSVVTSASDDLVMQPVCLNDLLEQSLAGFYGALTGRGITPEIQLPDRAVIRQLDAAAVRRVLENILSNAVKYSAGDLHVRLSGEGEITFSNHAENLDNVHSERLFDRFYTVETSRRASGLGLSIAKLLTQRMDGTISSSYRNGLLSISVFFPESGK